MRGRPYCKVSPRIVTGSLGRSIRGEGVEMLRAQSLASYLCHCPHGNAIGLYFLPVGYIMADRGWDVDGAHNALSLLEERGLVRYDQRTEWVWVIETFRIEFGPDPDRKHGDKNPKTGAPLKEDSRLGLVRGLLAEAAGSGLVAAFLTHYQPRYPYLLGEFESPVDVPSDAPSDGASTVRTTHRSRARVRVQDQDQDQDQEGRAMLAPWAPPDSWKPFGLTEAQALALRALVQQPGRVDPEGNRAKQTDKKARRNEWLHHLARLLTLEPIGEDAWLDLWVQWRAKARKKSRVAAKDDWDRQVDAFQALWSLHDREQPEDTAAARAVQHFALRLAESRGWQGLRPEFVYNELDRFDFPRRSARAGPQMLTPKIDPPTTINVEARLRRLASLIPDDFVDCDRLVEAIRALEGDTDLVNAKLAEMDAKMCARADELLSPEQSTEVEKRLANASESLRSRMPPDRLKTTLEGLRRDIVREVVGLPRLGIFSEDAG